MANRRSRGYSRDIPQGVPWKREYPDQWVCPDCHTYWNCDHSRALVVVCACSLCKLTRRCIRCKQYQPNRHAFKRLDRDKMPIEWQ